MTRLAGLLLCLIAICGADRAHGHATLVESSPPDGAVLAQPPSEVVLRFNEAIDPIMLRVLDIEARSVAGMAQARADNETLRLALPSDLRPATYVVTYRVISIDSHPVSGSIVFAVGNAAPPRAERTTAPRQTAVLAALIAVRAVFLAALLIAAGGMLALWRVAGFAPEAVGPLRSVLGAAASAALVLAPLVLGLVGCHLSGTPLAGLFQAATWRLAFGATAAQSLAVAATGLMLMLMALPRLQHGSNRLVGVTASLIALASFAVTGHAATAAPQWLMRWAVPVHALCAAFWLGALPLLTLALRGPSEQAYALAARFSNHAVAAVSTILLLGVAIAAVQVEHIAMLWQSSYGIVLVGKLAAALLLLGVAAHNRWYALPRLASGQDDAAQPLRRAIAAEYLLFAAILGFTATLTQIEPPRTAVARDTEALAIGRAGFRDSLTQSGYRMTLSVAPAEAGHNAIAVKVVKADGSVFTPREVTLDLSLPARGIAAISRNTVPDASGAYRYDGNDLALPGRWRIEVQVLVDDFTRVSGAFEVEIR